MLAHVTNKQQRSLQVYFNVGTFLYFFKILFAQYFDSTLAGLRTVCKVIMVRKLNYYIMEGYYSLVSVQINRQTIKMTYSATNHNYIV